MEAIIAEEIFFQIIISIKKVAQEEEIYFIQSYSPFFDRNNNLKEDLFCYDGLHLSPAGTRVFKTFIYDKIDRAIKIS